MFEKAEEHALLSGALPPNFLDRRWAKTRDKIAAQRRRGKWTGGTVPLGYSVVDKKLVVNDLEAVLVREIFSLYLRERSTLAVARFLNETDRSTKRHVAANGRLREARRWTKADVARLLRNPVYAGYMRSNGELYEGENPPIVDRETFSKVHGLLEDAARLTKGHGRNSDYILRGLLSCACCGSAFTPASTRKGRTEYRYYRCIRRDKEGREACPSFPLPAAAIEEYVIEQVRVAVAAGSLASEVEASVKERLKDRRKDLLTERKKLPAQIAGLSAEGKRLLATMADVDGVARRLAEERLQGLGNELGRSEGRLATVESELAAIEQTDVESSWVAKCLNDFAVIWDVLTPENRGRLLRAVVQRVEVDEPANKVKVFMVDLCPGMAEPIELEAAGGSGVSATASPGTQVVTGELHRVRCGRGKRFSAEPPREPPCRPARVAVMLALAHTIQRAIDRGEIRDQAEAARKLGVTRARLTQIVDLILLAPDLQERVLELEAAGGEEPASERTLRAVTRAPEWNGQRDLIALPDNCRRRRVRQKPRTPDSTVNHSSVTARLSQKAIGPKHRTFSNAFPSMSEP